MPIDENGIWRDTPGAGGGPMDSILGALNIQQSGMNNQRQRQMEMLKFLMSLRNQPDLSGYPEAQGAAQGAFGVSPETMHGISQDDPQHQYQAALDALPMDATPDEQNAVARRFAAPGTVLTQDTKARGQDLTQNRAELKDKTTLIAKFSSLGYTNAGAMAEAAIKDGASMDEISGGMSETMRARLEKLAAQTDEIGASTELKKAQAKRIPVLMKLDEARAAAAGTTASAAMMRATAARDKAAKLTGQQDPFLAASRLSNIRKGLVNQGMMMPEGSAEKAALQTRIKEIDGMVSDLLTPEDDGEEASTGMGDVKASETPQAATASAKKFPSEGAMVEAYKRDHGGQAPSPAIVAKARSLGWF